ncbi:MAG: glycosyltransferase [Opitutaceae bacterium]|nr:glycosyltransferase [Opitutaceae bacterium]
MPSSFPRSTKRNHCPAPCATFTTLSPPAGVPHEIVVVDDGSTDRTWSVLEGLNAAIPILTPIQNPGPHGFGHAIIYGLNHSRGDYRRR